MTIPKVFHWVWFGDKPMPEQHRHWIDGWLALHPGWEHKIWTDANRPTFVNEAEFLAADNFAMKSDIARYEIVCRYGGVYLDTDMECLQSLEPLLTDVEAFIASEEPDKLEPLATVILGATPGHPWLQDAIAKLPRAVATGFGNLHQTGPVFITSVTAERPDVTIFPERFFRHDRRLPVRETYAVHHGVQSWGDAGLAKYESKLRELVREDIEPVIPPGGLFILVDKGRGLELSDGRRSLPFPERDGEWAGYPANDAAAIEELERLWRAGAKFIVFPAPMFYWLDAFAGFRDYLHANTLCVLSNERALIFELSVPHTSYLICATPRSGSSLLCEALKLTRVAGKPGAYFDRGDMPMWSRRWGVSNYAEYLAKALEEGTTTNGVFGAKVMWGYFHDFERRLRKLPQYRELPLPELLPAVFPNLRYIRMTRRDKVRQAVSYSKAIQTEVWSQKNGQTRVPEKELAYDCEQIDQLVQEIVAHETAWDQYFQFCRVKPFTVVYEDFVAAYESTAIEVLRYLQVPVPDNLSFTGRWMIRQADALSEEWVQRHHEEQAHHARR
jgi:LPS sulfotransferase NodH